MISDEFKCLINLFTSLKCDTPIVLTVFRKEAQLKYPNLKNDTQLKELLYDIRDAYNDYIQVYTSEVSNINSIIHKLIMEIDNPSEMKPNQDNSSNDNSYQYKVITENYLNNGIKNISILNNNQNEDFIRGWLKFIETPEFTKVLDDFYTITRVKDQLISWIERKNNRLEFIESINFRDFKSEIYDKTYNTIKHQLNIILNNINRYVMEVKICDGIVYNIRTYKAGYSQLGFANSLKDTDLKSMTIAVLFFSYPPGYIFNDDQKIISEMWKVNVEDIYYPNKIQINSTLESTNKKIDSLVDKNSNVKNIDNKDNQHELVQTKITKYLKKKPDLAPGIPNLVLNGYF